MTRLPTSLLVRTVLIALLAFPAGVLARSASDDILTISQKRRTYAPTEVTIKAGDKIRIVNDDIFLHHAYVDSDLLRYDSGSMDEGESRDITFDDPGQYQVRCAIHPRMKLDVTVQ